VAEGESGYLDHASVHAWRTDGGAELRVEIEGVLTALSATVRRVFPASDPNSYFSIQDGSGREVGLLRGLDGLDPESRARFEEELDRRYFTPYIERVEDLRQDGGMWLFQVATQRGKTKFYVRSWRDSSHEIRPGRWLIFSVDGQRYLIRDWEDLDARSKDLLEKLF